MEPPFFREPHSAGKLRFNVRSLSAWSPGLPPGDVTTGWLDHPPPPDDGSAPDISFVPTMLRRRLDRTARMALHVAHRASAGLGAVQSVFASRHGELCRTAELLHALAAGELPSPASFSLSVHNATAGIFSITRADQSPTTAIAAGDETILWALQDAVLRMQRSGADNVVVVYADDSLPGEYAPFASASDTPFALALLLTPGSEVELAWGEADTPQATSAGLPKAIATWLARGCVNFAWHGERLAVQGTKHV